MKLAIRLAVLIAFAVVPVSSSELKQMSIVRTEAPSFIGYVEDELLIKLDSATVALMDRSAGLSGQFGISRLDAVADRFGAVNIQPRFPNAPVRRYQGADIDLRGWVGLKFKNAVDLDAAVADFTKQSGVLEAQKIGIHTVYAMPNDGSFPLQWHLNQANDHDIDAPEAWDIETGRESVIVGVLDTGVRYFHQDLGGSEASFDTPTAVGGNMWINWAEKNGIAGVDDDGNGYVDDWIGWDWVDGVNGWVGEDVSTPDNDPRDFNGHGTHCAGNIAAINNNGYAVASVAGGWNGGILTSEGNGVKVMPLRIGWSGMLGEYEVGYVRMDFAAAAIFYAANNGAKIISCSWASSNSGGLADAVNYYLATGGLIFKAAGNNNSQTADYLCSRSDVIAVAATDQNDVKTSFSNFGAWVDISAPGTEIYSLYHRHDDEQIDYVAAMNGTSMATPIAAGAAALIWSHNPSLNAEQVRQRLFDTADDIYGLEGNSTYFGKLGAGRVNAFAAINTGIPSAPKAQFTGMPVSGCAPLAVNFSDLSSGVITSWSWDFGNGSTSTQQNPATIYEQAGSYTVSLTVSGPGGSDVKTQVGYITVSSAPAAEFTASPTSGKAPLTVNFIDQSTGSPTGWSWDFGDGTVSTEQNPVHTFTAAGSYTVSMTAVNGCGSNTATKTNYVTVTNPIKNALHVAEMIVTKEPAGPRVRGKVKVKVVDENGAPQSKVTVSGQWSNALSESASFTTDKNGWGEKTTKNITTTQEFQFCVTDLNKSGYTYDPTANAATCACTDGTMWKQTVDNGADALAALDQGVSEKLPVISPNPFNPSTQLSFYLSEASEVQLTVYNILGEKIRTFFGERLDVGMHTAVWDAHDDWGRPVGTGAYFYVLNIDNERVLRGKLLYLK